MNEIEIELLQEQADAWKTVFYLCATLGMKTNVTGKSGLALVTAFIQHNAVQQSVQRIAFGAGVAGFLAGGIAMLAIMLGLYGVR